MAQEREAAVPQLQERFKARCAEVQGAWEARIEGAFEGLLQEVGLHGSLGGTGWVDSVCIK